MNDGPEALHDFPAPTPAPPALIERAWSLVRQHPECFWFWHPEARVRHLEDVRVLVEHLREYGDRRAWRDAQELHPPQGQSQPGGSECGN